MAMQLFLVAALIFASVVAVFALQNAQTVPIRFFAWERETSVAVIALGAAVVGALAAVLTGLVRQVAIGLRHRQLRAELGRVQKELEEERRAQQALLAELSRLQAASQAAGASPVAGVSPPAGPDQLPLSDVLTDEGDEERWMPEAEAEESLAGDEEKPADDGAEAAVSSDNPAEPAPQRGEDDLR